MTPTGEKPPLLPSQMAAPAPSQALRRPFLTLFFRGRGARGLSRKTVPKSIGEKLFSTLALYFLFGCLALTLIGQPVFAVAIYLHAMTFAFLGMFVVSSAGEVLFNKEEADILLHRPIHPRLMLWSKVRVLVEVSLWVAGAFNLAGLFAGIGSPDGGWRFPVVHALSTALEALFCAASVVLVYQLCLRWFGRERLEGLMTLTQVMVSVAVIVGSQLLPRFIFRFGHAVSGSESSWWIALFPPAWFAGFDDAFAGAGSHVSWFFAAAAVLVTAIVLWLAFGKLARDYEIGLQVLNESVSRVKKSRQNGRLMDRLVHVPPLSWWMRDPVERAAFLLTAAYLFRDRDVKLRIYPGVAPFLILPFIFLFQRRNGMGDFGIAFSGAYLGAIPLVALGMLQYSQQWQASDVFRSAPLPGPAPICHGARRAVLCILTIPILAAVVAIVWFFYGSPSKLLLILPGAVALPVYALVPGMVGRAVPLSAPTEQAKSAGRGLIMLIAMPISIALSFGTLVSLSHGRFGAFLAVETLIAAALYAIMRSRQNKVRWQSAE